MLKLSFVLFFFSCFFPALSSRAENATPETIRFSPLQEFSGLTKSEILEKRVQAVKNSPVFGDRADYTPSESVFQIEDGLPWIGAHEITCYGIKESEDIGRGLSRESAGILNPELLFVINMPSFAFHSTTGCSAVDYLLPYQATYNRSTNTVTAYIDYAGFYRKNGTYADIILEDANARDLGYKYAFAVKTRNIMFKQSVNFSKEITPTSGFFHKGFSCGKAEGCNNYSPYESRYHFYVYSPDHFAKLHIKLWKEEPEKTSDPADMNYVLIFR